MSNKFDSIGNILPFNWSSAGEYYDKFIASTELSYNNILPTSNSALIQYKPKRNARH